MPIKPNKAGTIQTGFDTYDMPLSQNDYLSYMVDPEALKRGDFIPITEPVLVKGNKCELHAPPPEPKKRKRRISKSAESVKPTKEQLAIDQKSMTREQIAVKYGVCKDTVRKWASSYGIGLGKDWRLKK